MANGNYSVLKENIDDYIKQNGDGDITGQVLQTQLFAMITSLGAGYQFMGVAKLTPTPTDPGSPDQNVFYVAFQPGIYSNFGSQTVADGEIAILKWNGSWTKEVTGAASAAKLDELGQEVDELQSAVSVSEPTGEDEDVLFETNAGNFSGKIDGEGGHFKNLYIQDNEAGTGRTDVAQELSTLSQGLSDAEEELTKLDSVEVSSTQNENQEIVVTDSDDNEVAKVNEYGITAKDVFVGGTPLSAFSFVGMTAIFDNLGFIGDSLSSGYLAAPDVGGESPAVPVGDGSKGRNIYRMSWGQILARMYGAKATNFSVGGLTAKGWLDTYPGKTSENGYNSDGTFAVTFNSQPKGFYTICLGTNDSADEITNPVGDVTTDIDTEDYHNNADTFAGNYAKIIQLCRELTPSCKIFVITPFSWWSYGAESKGYNDVVRAMPGIFDKVYLIDLYTDYYGHTPQYVYGGHGTTMGYVFTATAIAKAIDSIVRANEDDFKFQSIVTRARQDEGQY